MVQLIQHGEIRPSERAIPGNVGKNDILHANGIHSLAQLQIIDGRGCSPPFSRHHALVGVDTHCNFLPVFFHGLFHQLGVVDSGRAKNHTRNTFFQVKINGFHSADSPANLNFQITIFQNVQNQLCIHRFCSNGTV